MTDLRTLLKAQRLALSPEFQAHCAQAIAAHVIEQGFFKESQDIAFYWPVNGEVSPQLIIEAAQKLDKRCYLPVLALDKPDHLWFMPFDAKTVFVKNRFGIPEPALEVARLFPPHDLDLVMTPLVAFDAQCHRIGMGAGFYDRTFAFLQDKPRPAKPLLCGLAYSFQQVDNTGPQPWDVALNDVITDQLCFKAMSS